MPPDKGLAMHLAQSAIHADLKALAIVHTVGDRHARPVLAAASSGAPILEVLVLGDSLTEATGLCFGSREADATAAV
jgi:hypothetical protein